MDLSTATGGLWLTYYRTFDFSQATNIIKINAEASYWQNQCPTYMQYRGAPQISGDVRFSSIEPHLTARTLIPSPVSLSSNHSPILTSTLILGFIQGKILTGPFKDNEVLVPKITLFPEGDSTVKVLFYRYQFPVSLAFAMTINKNQGKSMNYVGLVLENQPFAHGQLYVGLS
jgi:hypothetical protein